MLLGLLALKKNLFATFRIDFTVNYKYVINNIIGKFLLKAIGFESPLTHTHNVFNFDYKTSSTTSFFTSHTIVITYIW